MIPQLGAVVVAAILFALIYDPFHVGALVFLALTPITLVFANPRQNITVFRAGLWGFVFGLLASLAIVGPWMTTAARDYFGNGLLWSIGFTTFVNSIYVALFFIPAFMAIRILAFAQPMTRVFGVASVWIVFETLRAMDPAGNVWAHLGQGFAYLPLFREAAAYGGQPLLGWLAALCGAAIGVGLQGDVDSSSSANTMKTAIAAVALTALLGGIEQHRDPEKSPIKPLRVAVVQAEIASRDVWDPAQRMAHWNAYVAATESIPRNSVDLVVWPESAVPFLLDADATARARITELTATTGAAILLGAPRADDDGKGNAAIYNSAYFFAAGATEYLTYDKRRLLPYVETSPVEGSDLPAAAAYRAGDWPGHFDVKGWRIAPLICFESLYPEYSREAVLDGAHLLVNLSNDAWFAGGAGPEQHYAMSLIRTVELRRAMVRASNGGISGAIAPDGSEIGISLERQKAVGIYEIPSPSRRMTVAATQPWMIPVITATIAFMTVAYGIRRMAMPDLEPLEDEEED